MQFVHAFKTFCSLFTNCLRPFCDFNYHTVTSNKTTLRRFSCMLVYIITVMHHITEYMSNTHTHTHTCIEGITLTLITSLHGLYSHDRYTKHILTKETLSGSQMKSRRTERLFNRTSPEQTRGRFNRPDDRLAFMQINSRSDKHTLHLTLKSTLCLHDINLNLVIPKYKTMFFSWKYVWKNAVVLYSGSRLWHVNNTHTTIGGAKHA